MNPFAMLDKEDGWAIGVSGGGDSVALLHMLLAEGKRPVVLHFNHKWSNWGDKAEAFVRKLCAKHGLDCVVGHGKGRTATNAEETARKARYAFFAKEVVKRGLAGVMVAHTQDDDVEGFFIRLARGSAVKGLSGMAADGMVGGVRVLRPLLGHTREDLRAYLKEQNLRYLNDPSNMGDDTMRARIRKLMPKLEQAGLHPQHIAASMASLQAADAALEQAAEDVWRQHGTLAADRASCPLQVVRGLTEEVGVRLVLRLLAEAGQPAPLPRRSKCVSVLSAMLRQARGKQSLGRCHVVWDKGGVVVICAKP
ncbi:MAG: tRNA lysidine(34) synthetase TilS [Pseudomonadaceae bacterium]|nr:tRNA lysidine(34) synthetase TilS [Pseudomonadaceae bacterium]